MESKIMELLPMDVDILPAYDDRVFKLILTSPKMYMLELPKLRRQPEKENLDALECWLRYLDNKEVIIEAESLRA